jgi:hypothetical protein
MLEARQSFRKGAEKLAEQSQVAASKAISVATGNKAIIDHWRKIMKLVAKANRISSGR